MSIALKPVCQQTDSHCGPAVMELLLSHLGKKTTQDTIVAAARSKSKVLKYGVQPDRLALAIAKLYPDLKFWFKQDTSLLDLEILVNKYHVPVGINWQALFYDTLEEELRNFPKRNIYGDHGHYSVIVDACISTDTVTIADTYCDYYKTPRIFSYTWFDTRWWDKVLKVDQNTKKVSLLSTNKLAIVILPKSETFPKILGMKPASELPKFIPTKKLLGKSHDIGIKQHN